MKLTPLFESLGTGDGYPPKKWLLARLREWPGNFNRPVLDMFIVGSEAKGTARPDSDIDVAVIINPIRGKDALKVSEYYHQKFTSDLWRSRWNGRLIDFQFFYPGDPELEGYSKIPLR